MSSLRYVEWRNRSLLNSVGWRGDEGVVAAHPVGEQPIRGFVLPIAAAAKHGAIRLLVPHADSHFAPRQNPGEIAFRPTRSLVPDYVFPPAVIHRPLHHVQRPFSKRLDRAI